MTTYNKLLIFGYILVGIMFFEELSKKNTPFLHILGAFALFVLFTYPFIKRTSKDSNKNNSMNDTGINSKMVLTVRVKNGTVEEYVNGQRKRFYGTGIQSADTDGKIIATVTRHGTVEEYVNGQRKRTYGSNAVDVQVTSGTVIVSTKNGKTEEYVNGQRKNIY